MTQRDKWKKRPVVTRYHEFRDLLRMEVRNALIASGHTGLGCAELMKEATELSWTAYFPIPPSWSGKKKLSHQGQPHRQKPDRDNIDKAIMDSLFEEDCGIHAGTIRKLWDDGEGARIVIEVTV